MPHRRLLLLVLLAQLTPLAPAQRQRCGTPSPVGLPSEVPSDCGYLTNDPEPEYEPSCTYHVPVVFHVIQNTSGSGFLSAQTIQDQIDVLNEDFNAIPGSPGAPGTEARIQFHLATEDPGGNPTTGITYSANNSWFQDNGTYWNSLAWDTHRYMNIYTNEVPCCYGYVSDFPGNGVAGDPDDRIVLWWEAVGKDPTPGWPLNMGRTATHEVGHYLGLYHTFDSGCGSATNCYGTSDLICDTEQQANPTSGCPSSSNSCGSPNPIHNYMDYTDDPCLWEFTPEQVNRMRCNLVHWRPDVWSTSSTDLGDSYCTSTPNSSGAPGVISASGNPSLALNDLTLSAESCAASNFGIFFYAENQVQVVFGDGFRCAGGTIHRLPPPLFTDAAGAGQRVLDFQSPPLGSGSGAALPGSTWNFQFWFRDPMGPGGTGFNLTDGLSIAFCP